jgi:3-dehydroquinate dehydratase-2
MKIQIINGPNLNLLGKRGKNLYGIKGFDEYLKLLRELYPSFSIDYFQSNVEGEIINKIHETGFSCDGLVINAGGYSHTSVAIADAIASVTAPAVEVHITNLYAREEFRHASLVGRACKGCIMGFGLDTYRLAVESLRVLQGK